jgi:hypothetical protein
MRTLFFVSPLLSALPCLLCAAPAKLSVVGDWQIRIEAGPITVGERQASLVASATLDVAPSTVREVKDEGHEKLPMFNPKAGGWARGAPLLGVQCQECTGRFLLDPESFHLKKGKGTAEEWRRGVDYEVDLEWGTFGRLEGGAMTAESMAYADYRHGLARLDTVVVTAAGQALIKTGTPAVATPKPPDPAAGELWVCTLYTTSRQAKLSDAALFPVLELAYPEPPAERPTPAERVLPKTLAKLRSGEKLRVLAWGDSVTGAGYLPHPDDRWQVQFVTRLKARFPKADIELLHLGWGGRNTHSFLAEPPGSEFNYQEKVLGARADLIVSEFVNDAWLNPAQTKELYGKLLADFQACGSEWIILTPHYVRPDWMGFTSERDCDDDPRPYVQALRGFASENPVALADGSRRYGRLWRMGIPYNTLMMNAINHPNPFGMKLFADAIMALFPEP